MYFFRFSGSLHFKLLRIAVLVALIAGSLMLAVHFYAAAASPFISIAHPTIEQYLNSKTPEISGLTEANLTVNVYIDDLLAGSITADTAGRWSFIPPALAEGGHSVRAETANEAGETGISGPVVFTVDTVPPVVTVTRPLAGSYVNQQLLEGVTEPGIPVTVFVYNSEFTVTSDPLGKWMYFADSLPEGSHSVSAQAVDRAGNTGSSASSPFILDMTRPVVLPNLIPPDEMNHVLPDVMASVYIKEENPLDAGILQDAIQVSVVVSDLVYESVNGRVYSSVYTDMSGVRYYNLVFKPDLPLRPATRYTVSVNPALADAAGNPVHPRTWAFTTLSDALGENPHGNYTSNVNTCRNCHRPHVATGPRINSPPQPQMQTIDNYCNACHDGTSAPIPPSWDQTNKHDFQLGFDGIQGTSSCATCHNPHLTWTTDNPNMLQDYYYYDHNDPTNPFIPDSSEQKLCESCHPADIKNDSRVTYVAYRYNKRHTTAGQAGDYSLCLGCHDGGKAVNIAVYYSGPSRHVVAAYDASPLNGHLACADCHETHGSSNIKLLKNRLGHNNAQAFTAGGQWDAAAERNFCTGCHNNFTELYGKTVELDAGTPGHQSGSPEACSICHGGSPQKAAHAPQ